MKAPIHYSVVVKLVRFANDGEIDFIEEDKEFTDDSPINAREEAFRFYQNYVDVLLMGVGAEYENHKQAANLMNPFLSPGFDRAEAIEKLHSLSQESPEWEKLADTLSKASHLGISVNMIIDQPFPDEILDDKPGDYRTIHEIGRYNNPQSNMDALDHEYWYYEYYKLDTKNYLQCISYVERDEAITEPDDHDILWTPFDWSGLDKLSDEELSRLEEYFKEDDEQDESENDQYNDNRIHTLHELLLEGEGPQVEFKPALLYNFKSGKPGISVKAVIAKAICGLVNSKGGVLFIGVKDDGTVQGLDNDFDLCDRENREDWFRLEFDQMISHFFSHAISNNVSGYFEELDGKTVFICIVSPSKSGPFYMNGYGNSKELYVRALASTQQLRTQAEIEKYCAERWPNYES